MPFYDYVCECGNKATLSVPVADRDGQACPECGEVMKRKLSIPQRAIIRQTGSEMALNTLNKEYSRPANDANRRREARGAFAGVR